MRLRLFFCPEVDRLHRLLHRRDRFDRDAKVNWLAIRHTAGDAAGAIRKVPKPPLLVVDLVVKLRAAAGRALKPRAELDSLDRVDRHHGLGQLAVQLAVPVDIAAEAGRHSTRDDAERPAQRVSRLPDLVDCSHHSLRRLWVRTPDWREFDVLLRQDIGIDALEANVDRADRLGEAQHFDAELAQQLPRNPACRDPRRRLARR